MELKKTRNVLWCAGLIFSSVLMMSVYHWAAGLARSGPFLVREVEIHWVDSVEPNGERFRLAPPTSVFSVDLENVDQSLQVRYPTARVQAVRRVLPNRVIADLVSKRVIAQIKTGLYYPVSVDGTVLMEGKAAPWPELPVIRFALYKEAFEIGQICEHPAFPQSARLLAAVYRSGGLGGHRAVAVRFKTNMLILELKPGCEIWFDPEKLEENWSRLTVLLKNKPAVLDEAVYLDLRFQNPTIVKKGAVR